MKVLWFRVITLSPCNIVLSTTKTILATCDWETSSDDFADGALGYLVTRFTVPLEHAAVDMYNYCRMEGHATILSPISESCSRAKRCDMVEAFQFVKLQWMGKRTHFNWALVLYSYVIKTDRWNNLSENHIDDLLTVSVDGPPLDKWQATSAIELWWKSKQRRSESQYTTKVRKSLSKVCQFGSLIRANSILRSSDTRNNLFDRWNIIKTCCFQLLNALVSFNYLLNGVDDAYIIILKSFTQNRTMF